ncbi:hypothetical protein IAT38_003635 [Cryptococcus sp. DSM 104549]
MPPVTRSSTRRQPPPLPRTLNHLLFTLPGEIRCLVFTHLVHANPVALLSVSRATWKRCVPLLYSHIDLTVDNMDGFFYGFAGPFEGGSDGAGEGNIINDALFAGPLFLSPWGVDGGRSGNVNHFTERASEDGRDSKGQNGIRYYGIDLDNGPVPRSSTGRKLASFRFLWTLNFVHAKAQRGVGKVGYVCGGGNRPVFASPLGVTPTVIYNAPFTTTCYDNILWDASQDQLGGESRLEWDWGTELLPVRWRQVWYLPKNVTDEYGRETVYGYVAESGAKPYVKQLCVDQVWPCEMELIGTETLEMACPEGRHCVCEGEHEDGGDCNAGVTGWKCAGRHEGDEDCIMDYLLRAFGRSGSA